MGINTMRKSSLLILLLLRYTDGNKSFESPYEGHDVEHFDRAVRSGHYVDKTSLLKAFIEYTSQHRHLLITCPNNFGKSTNMDMLRRFFHVRYNRHNYRHLERKKSYYYQLFTNETLNLNVTGDAEFIRNHHAQYFVFYLDFSVIKGKTGKQIVHSIRDLIKEILNSHLWLYMKMKDRMFYKRKPWENPLLQGFRKGINSGGDEETALKGLESLLSSYALFTAKPLMVLIDNYDAPMLRAINLGVRADEVNLFMQSILGVIHNVTFYYEIKHTLTVGVSRWFKDERTSKIAAKIDYQYFQQDHGLIEYFGFTDGQVRRLMADKPAEHAAVREYYNGYYVRNLTTPLYNPKGVLQYLETDTFDFEYHSDDGIVHSLMKCLRHRAFFEKMLQLYVTRNLKRTSHIHMSVDDLHKFTDIVHRNCADFDSSIPYGTILLDSGYVAAIGAKNPYRLPNDLMREKLRRDFLHFYQHHYGITVKNPQTAESLLSIFSSEHTTPQILSDLRDSLNAILLKCTSDNRTLDEFQFQSIILAAIFFNVDVEGDIAVAEIGKTKSKFSLATTPFTDNHRRTLVILRISLNKKLIPTINRAEQYVPVEPRNSSSFRLIKYLGVNMNLSGNIEVASGKNRCNW